MLKTTFRRAFIVLLCLGFAGISAASASLMPMSYGFPTMQQFAQNTAFNNGFVNAFDFETADISPFGSFGFGFPTVGESEVQGQTINQCEFAQNTVFTTYSYPTVSTGLGFNGFGDFTGFGL